MVIEEAIRHRRSIRQFLPDPVSVAEIREMLSLASLAPNIGNRQNWRFIVVTDDGLRRMLARLVERMLDEMETWPEFLGQGERLRAMRSGALHFANAPVAIFVIKQEYHSRLEEGLVAHGNKITDIERQFAYPDYQSVSCVIAYLTLLAEARGLGACWLTDPLIARKDLHASLELKPGEELQAILSMGKPAEYPPPRPRKAIDSLIEWR